MRTTITLREDQREKLLKLAAERGEKSYTKIIQDAVARYLAEQEALTTAPPTAPALPDRRMDRIATLLRSLQRESLEGVQELVRSLVVRVGLRRQSAEA